VATGGSATTDGGQGAIDLIQGYEEVLAGISIEVLSDVTVKFEDAATVFAPQKGADPITVEILTAQLDHVAERYAKRYGRDPRGLAQTGGGRGDSLARCGLAWVLIYFRERIIFLISWALTTW